MFWKKENKQKLDSHSKKELKRIERIVKKIESYRESMGALTDEQLQHKTIEFKERIKKGESLDSLLPEAYAAIREADKRVLGMEPFRVQLIGGIILHQGRIAEMKTGEGKTLVATLPAYLNALEGKGVHIITVNDYLASRDAEQMGQVYRFMGLTVGCVLANMNKPQRKEQYDCDITYITNNEDGFDYLRDNMAINQTDIVQRGLHYAIIDEVDSVLIDEARTPLIISGASGKSTNIYTYCDLAARQMVRGKASKEFSKMDAIMGEEIVETGDFIVDEKDKVVTLTAAGVKKVEKFFNIKNFSDPENLEIQHNIMLALRANNLMHKDQDYIVQDGKILIVDEFTGRVMDGRRYSDGLHQAIEAKEHVEIKQESQTLATITFQNFFNKYDKKSGMTGTAKTEEEEFRNVYSMDVVAIPTNRPVIRKDLPDVIYMTKKEKYEAVVEEVAAAYKKRQPVLLGTINIDSSEMFSEMLKAKGIPHQVLNAKNNASEAEIVAHAGEAGSVTIATNMAGRGTDIKLDEEARTIGGLKIVGTERHDSRRIDNQLRGRSGRQGDPGESRFYISLEDDLMRRFGSDKMINTFKNMGIEHGQMLEDKILSRSVEAAQSRIEDNNFGIRKNLLDYDMVNNEQREMIYGERKKVLAGDNMRETVMHMIEDIINRKIDETIGDRRDIRDWDLDALNRRVMQIIPTDPVTENILKDYKIRKKADLSKALIQHVKTIYKNKEEEMPNESSMREIERYLLLRVIDMKWKAHLDDMEQLRQWIGIQAYGQKDPKVEYRMRAYEMFNEMTEGIQEETVHALYGVQPAQPTEESNAEEEPETKEEKKEEE